MASPASSTTSSPRPSPRGDPLDDFMPVFDIIMETIGGITAAITDVLNEQDRAHQLVAGRVTRLNASVEEQHQAHQLLTGLVTRLTTCVVEQQRTHQLLTDRVTRLENPLPPDRLITFIRIMEAIPPLTIYFGNNSASIPKNDYRALDSIAAALHQYPAAHLCITGHSDGTRKKAEEKISFERASVVSTHLLQKFRERDLQHTMVDVARVFFGRVSREGLGSSEPVAVIPKAVSRNTICTLHRRAVIKLDRVRTLRALGLEI